LGGKVHGTHAALPEQALEAVLFVQHLTDVSFQTSHLRQNPVRARYCPDKGLNCGGRCPKRFRVIRSQPVTRLTQIVQVVRVPAQPKWASRQFRLRNASSRQKFFNNSTRILFADSSGETTVTTS